MYTELEKEIIFNMHLYMLKKITCNFRCVFLQINKFDLDILVYFKEKPTEIEIEFLEDFETNINAATLELNTAKSRFIVSKDPFEHLEKLSHCIYAKYEDSV